VADSGQRRRHLLLRGGIESQPYTYPKPVRGRALALPPRDRAGHGARLLAEVEQARKELDQLNEARRAVGISDDLGICVQFESDPGFGLALKSLDQGQQGIELLAVRERAAKTVATVFVPAGKLKRLTSLIRSYLDEETGAGLPQPGPRR